MVFDGKACTGLCAGDSFLRCHRCGARVAEVAFHLYAQTLQSPFANTAGGHCHICDDSPYTLSGDALI